MQLASAVKSGAVKLTAVLLCGICGWLLVSVPAHAKPVPPLTMTAAFDNTRPELDRIETMRVRLTTTEDYTNLNVAVTLPPEMALVSGGTRWQGPLAAGAKREMVLKVRLLRPGRYSVTIDAYFDPAESAFESARIHLNIIAEPNGVQASTDSFLRMDLNRRGALGMQGDVRLDCAEEIPCPPAVTVPMAVPDFFKSADEYDGQPSGGPDALAPRATTIRVSGNVRYRDSANRMHPVRLARTEVLNVKNGAETVIGRGYTAADGSYAIRAVTSARAPDVQVRVYSAVPDNNIVSVGPDMSRNYYMSSAVRSNYNQSTLTISIATGRPVRGSASDSSSARIFSVMDAVLQAAAESYAWRGNNVMPLARIVYPANSSFYRPSDGGIRLLRFDALDWDVIMHEYGHFLAHRGASARFDNSPGGSHSGGTTIPLHGKDKGIRLAWSEGFATWFAIMAQMMPSQRLLTLPGVPNSGNRFYQDTEDANIKDDLETPTRSHGYSSGNSIQGMLYDLCDTNADRSSTGLSRDNVSVRPKVVWDIMNSGPWDNVGKFYNRICAMIGLDIPALFRVSEVFAMNNIGPELVAPAEGDIVSSSISPEFSWRPNGDPTTGFGHNRFTLVVANHRFSQILAIKNDIAATRYRFPPEEWQAMMGLSDDTGTFQWAVIGHNTATPRIPPAGGIGGFLSNMQNFKVRAYHIRLRWSPNGADVDLHLRPPSGASYSGWRYPDDCAYYNRNPDWGVKGDPRDNPYLDRDCTTSGTEENITLDTVTDPGLYKVLVHYYNDHRKGPATARVDVYRYGRWLAGSQTTLRNPDHGPSSGDIWVPFTFRVGRSGVEFMDYTPEDITRSTWDDDALGVPEEFFDKSGLDGESGLYEEVWLYEE